MQGFFTQQDGTAVLFRWRPMFVEDGIRRKTS